MYDTKLKLPLQTVDQIPVIPVVFRWRCAEEGELEKKAEELQELTSQLQELFQMVGVVEHITGLKTGWWWLDIIWNHGLFSMG